MTFTDAVEVMLDSKRVTREEWKDKRHYVLLESYILQYHKAGEPEGLNHPLIVQEADLVAEDWIVV